MIWRVTLVVVVGGMCGSVGGKVFNANMELVGVRKERHSNTTCMEAAGGTGSSVKELLRAT